MPQQRLSTNPTAPRPLKVKRRVAVAYSARASKAHHTDTTNCPTERSPPKASARRVDRPALLGERTEATGTTDDSSSGNAGRCGGGWKAFSPLPPSPLKYFTKASTTHQIQMQASIKQKMARMVAIQRVNSHDSTPARYAATTKPMMLQIMQKRVAMAAKMIATRIQSECPSSTDVHTTSSSWQQWGAGAGTSWAAMMAPPVWLSPRSRYQICRYSPARKQKRMPPPAVPWYVRDQRP
mmetsp:Transcript_69878/g.202513  ORF Transcript_69878/g.202513 Transcript_69878/m.202513 type:complete len:238 (-) Transcript_69878:1499-2212(-)